MSDKVRKKRFNLNSYGEYLSDHQEMAVQRQGYFPAGTGFQRG